MEIAGKLPSERVGSPVVGQNDAPCSTSHTIIERLGIDGVTFRFEQGRRMLVGEAGLEGETREAKNAGVEKIRRRA